MPGQKNLTVTDTQMKYILDNHKKISYTEIGQHLGLTKGVVSNNLNVFNKAEKTIDKSFLNVNERKNWLI